MLQKKLNEKELLERKAYREVRAAAKHSRETAPCYERLHKERNADESNHKPLAVETHAVNKRNGTSTRMIYSLLHS